MLNGYVYLFLIYDYFVIAYLINVCDDVFIEMQECKTPTNAYVSMVCKVET